MAESDHAALSVRGEVSWENGLFGALELPSDLAQVPAQSPLLSSGSGRIWMSEDGVRVESQGGGGDQIVAVSKASRTVWTYDSASNTARRFDMKADGRAASPLPTPPATPATVLSSTFLQRLAPYATVDVTGQTTVADRAAYVLRMTPAAGDTALGKVEAAIDGETMLPLRLDVYAAGAAQPALRFGFDTISYEPVDAALFEFTPPHGAEVTTETLEPAERAAAGATPAADDEGGKSGLADKAAREQLARQALLTLGEAQALVDFRLARPRDYDARPFRHAYVANGGGFLTAAGTPLFGASGDSKERSTSPSSALVYGSGFGAITLVQTRTTEDLTTRLEQLPAPAQTSASADRASSRAVFTPLGGVVIWQEGETTLMAGGLVTQADLEAFVRAVR